MFPLFKSAESIVRRGGHIIRLDPGTKACTTPGWQNTATQDLNVIAGWNEGNYGVVGKEGSLFALDIDSEGLPVLAEYEAQFGPVKTLRDTTPNGGCHLFFIHDERSWALGNVGEKVPKNKGEGEVWSLRADNRYVVGPGSTVADKKYRVVDTSECVTMPQSLIDFLRARVTAAAEAEAALLGVSSPSCDTTKGTVDTKVKHTKEYWDAQINSSDDVPEGGRNDFLTSVAGILVMRGIKDDTLYVALSAINERRLNPTLPDKEVLAISRSVSKYKKTKLEQLFAQSTQPGLKPAAEYAPDQFLSIIDLLAFSSTKRRQSSGLDIPENGDRALQEAAKLIWERIKMDATVFSAGGVGYLMFKDHEDKPIKISPDDPLFADLLQKYNLLATQKQFNLIGTYMGKRSEIEGIKTTVRRGSHYNDTTKSFYFAESRGNLIKADGGNVERVKNGTDGELFLFGEDSDLCIDIDNLPKIQNALVPEEGSELYKVLFGGLKFIENDFMTDHQKHILMTAWVLTLLLPGITAGRIGFQGLGPSGCGKTFFLRVVGRIVVGETFEVRALPSSVAELENQLINNSLCFFDNAENPPYAMKTAFCMAATGGWVARRELFTTAKEVKNEIQASIGISAVSPIFPNTEIANRSLIINLQERPESSNQDEKYLIRLVDERRVPLLTELIARAQTVLRANTKHADFNPSMSLRMASFGSLIMRVAREEGWESEAQELLTDWHECQLMTALQNDDISSALRKWMARIDWKPCELTAEQLNSILGQGHMSFSDQQKLSWKNSPKVLSNVLRHSEKSYSKLFGLTIVRERDHSRYKFAPTPDMLADIREMVAKETLPQDVDPNGPRTLPQEENQAELSY